LLSCLTYSIQESFQSVIVMVKIITITFSCIISEMFVLKLNGFWSLELLQTLYNRAKTYLTIRLDLKNTRVSVIHISSLIASQIEVDLLSW